LRPEQTFGHDRFHLTDGVQAVAAPGDGSVLAAGSSSETVVWDVATAKVVARTNACSYSLAFEDGSTLWMAMASVHRWRLWQNQPEEFASDLRHPLAISLATRMLAAAQDPTDTGDVGIRGLDGSGVSRIAGKGTRVASLSFSRDGEWLAIGDEEGARLIGLVTGMDIPLSAPSSGRRVTVRFAPHSHLVAVAREVSKEIVLVRLDRTVERTLAIPDFFAGLAFTPDGSRLAVTHDAGVTVFDVGTGETVASSTEKGDWNVVAFASRQRAAVCAIRGVRFFDVSTQRWDAVPPTHTDRVAAIAIAPDESWSGAPRTFVATSGRFDRTLNLWRVVDGGLLHSFRLPIGAATLSIAPDGRTVVAGTFGGDVIVLDVGTGGEQTADDAHENFNVGVAHLPDGTIVSAGGGRIVLRDPTTAKERETFATYPRGTSTDDAYVTVSADGRWLALSVEDRLTVYDGRDPVFTRSNAKHGRIAPDAPLVGFVEEGALILAELPSGRAIARWDIGGVSDLVMLGGGRVAVVHFRGRVEILEIGQPAGVIVSEDRPAASAGIGGNWIAIGYEDGTAALVILPPSRASARVQARDDELGPIRALIRGLGLRTHAVVYRDAPQSSGMDPDECGIYLVREGVEMRVRGDCRDGRWVLAAARATSGEAIVIPEEDDLFDRVKGWFRTREGRYVVRRGSMSELPTAEDLDTWLTACAVRWAGR
jgi:WD40 repeat protein